jgi:hypothetical protein
MTSAGPSDDKNYKGPERRNELPTMELWQENIKSLNSNNLTNLQMRYALSGSDLTFLVRFENEVPSGKLDLVFPEMEHANLIEEGWQKFVLTIFINDEGELKIEMRGRYERDEVPLDVKLEFTRDIGMGVGIDIDVIQMTDTRSGESGETSLGEIIDEHLKDGERRYARKNDETTNVSVEGMVAILSRFLKQFSVSRRVLHK